MKLQPEARLVILGGILFLALLICSCKFSDLGAPSFIAWLVVAGLAYLLAIRELFSAAQPSKRVIVIGLIMAAVWHFLFLLKPPGPDDDIHRYLWDGRVQRLGYNPYLVVPGNPALAGLHTPETSTLNHPDLPSPYPPGAQLFFRGVTAIHESVLTLKIAFVLCDLAIMFLLFDLLRRAGQGAQWILAYAWNPLLPIEVAGSGHVDILGAMLLLISVAALWRKWRALAAVAFALSVGVKFLPIVLVPLYWRRLRLRDALLAVIVFGMLYLPFLERGRILTGSLGAYVQSFRFNDPVFAMLEQVASPQAVAGLAVLVGLLVAGWMRSRSNGLSSDAFVWPMAASFFFAPVVYPWYLLWALPFVRSVATLPIMVWTVSIIPAYYVWHLRTLGRPWLVPGWIILLEYGAVAITGAVLAMRRLQRSSASQCISN